MKTLGQRLKFARRNRPGGPLTQEALAKLSGISQTTIADLERGRNEKSKHTVTLARALQCDVDWLETGKGDWHLKTKETRSHPEIPLEQEVALTGRVPLISFVAAGNWETAVDNYSPGDAERWIHTTVPAKRHTYAVRVQGDSMTNPAGTPSFPDGCIIIVEPEEEPRHKKFVIVRQRDDVTFKQLIVEGSRQYLQPLNPRYPIMELDAEAVFCGVVKGKCEDI